MKHILVRCEHCGTEFWDSGPNRGYLGRVRGNYCPECRRVIENALETIPVRFEARWREVEDEEITYSSIEEKRKEIENREKGEITIVACVCMPYGMRSGEVVIINHVQYGLCVDKEGGEHVYVMSEYDKREESFTGKVWKTDYEDCTYRMMASLSCSAEEVVPIQIPVPMGDIFFFKYIR